MKEDILEDKKELLLDDNYRSMALACKMGEEFSREIASVINKFGIDAIVGLEDFKICDIIRGQIFIINDINMRKIKASNTK